MSPQRTAPRRNSQADIPHLCRMSSEVGNKVLAETRNEGRALHTANAAVAKATRSMK